MKHLKALIFSLIACTFVPALIVVAFSYWQKLVDEVDKLVEDLPLLDLLWNILQIALALGLLLALAWVIRKVFSYLKSDKKPKIDTDSSNIIISVIIALISSSVILGIAGFFSNPVTNIVKILLSFIDDPLATDSYSGIYSDGLTPMKSSVMMFTNIALFCWTAYWSFIFILGIVEEIRGKNPEANQTRALLKQYQVAQQPHFQSQQPNTGQANLYQQAAPPQPQQASGQTNYSQPVHQGQFQQQEQYKPAQETGQTRPVQSQAPQGYVHPPRQIHGQQVSNQGSPDQMQQRAGQPAPAQTQQPQQGQVQPPGQRPVKPNSTMQASGPLPISQNNQQKPDSPDTSTPSQE